ncbi:hypothetical protein ACOKFD_15725 [Flagellimonas sp. S174]|uniref:hypothetical protein n=1 Tax=Flagellimonas sp. S174 TaxID=3410790 RepID=UPI003BF5D1D3
MKILIYILPIMATAQIHLGVGITEISQREDGTMPYYWNVGYNQEVGKFGVGFNYRATKVLARNFRSWEFRVTHRIIDGDFKMVLGTGWAFNQEEKDSYPVVHFRNGINISDGLDLILDFDNSFRMGGRKRTESYLGLGLALEYDFIKDVIIGRQK